MDRMGNSLDRALFALPPAGRRRREVRLAGAFCPTRSLKNLPPASLHSRLTNRRELNGEGSPKNYCPGPRKKRPKRGLDGPSVRAALENRHPPPRSCGQRQSAGRNPRQKS